jgi:hypothetical protein
MQRFSSIGRTADAHSNSEHASIERSSLRQQQEDSRGCEDNRITSMSELNALVQQGWQNRMVGNAQGAQNQQLDPSFMKDSAWEQWLWHEDPMEESHIDLLLNRMQLLGLLIARFVLFLFFVKQLKMYTRTHTHYTHTHAFTHIFPSGTGLPSRSGFINAR